MPKEESGNHQIRKGSPTVAAITVANLYEGVPVSKGDPRAASRRVETERARQDDLCRFRFPRPSSGSAAFPASKSDVDATLFMPHNVHAYRSGARELPHVDASKKSNDKIYFAVKTKTLGVRKIHAQLKASPTHVPTAFSIEALFSPKSA